jgi:iron complex outermembrane receptor protein
MQDSSRSLFSTLKPKSSQALRLAVLTAMGGAASLGAQAQSVSGDNPAAVKAAVGIAVQDGIQILNSAQSQTSKKPQASQSSRKAQSTIASAAGNEPKRIGAYDENTLLAQSSTPATGDASTDQTSEAPELQEVVVTGSMIARPTAETAEAVTTISVDTLKAQGITTAEEALQRISANMTGNAYVTASAVTTFDGGAAYANLRGIGSNKTLVLLDGQRVATNVVTGDGIDLSTIPFAAIDNIEVLREGASSLYGTDAIGGVINFITKKNYQKGELDIDATKPEDGGGGGTDASVTLGHGSLADDGYNFLFAGDFNYGAELRAAQRPFADIGFVPGANLAGATTNNPYTTPGSFIDNAGNQYQVNYPSCPTNDHLTTYYPGECTYIYTTATDLIPRNIKESGLAELTKTLPGNNQLEIQYFYARSDLDTWAGPESYSALVTPASPYYPTVAESVCATAINPGCAGVPPVLGGDLTALWTDAGNSRNNEFVNTEQRLLLTFSGDNAGWDYATDFNFSLNHDNQYVAGYPDLSYIENGAGELDPSINPFGAQSAAGAALLRESYSEDGKVAVGTYREWIVDAHASHKLGDAFNAGREAAVAIGAQVEGEHVGYTTTPLATYLPPTPWEAGPRRPCLPRWTSRWASSSISRSRIVKTATAISAPPTTARCSCATSRRSS